MLGNTSTADWLSWLGRLALFSARSYRSALAALPRLGWWVRPLHDVVIGGLPLAAVAGLAFGLVLWLHTRDIFERTGVGAAELLPTVLSAAVLLELAPVGAGLIVAARTGASLATELASMQTTEQVDALELLGVSPLKRVVGPRVVACVFGAPLLHIAIAFVAISSGFLAERAGGRTTALRYDAAAVRELALSDVLPAAGKTLIFGALVGATACFIGLSAGGGSEGVGRAATDSVVICSLLVLASDVVLAALIRGAQKVLL